MHLAGHRSLGYFLSLHFTCNLPRNHTFNGHGGYLVQRRILCKRGIETAAHMFSVHHSPLDFFCGSLLFSGAF
jgi:hypothetical protein